jgi:EAL domain-containing protein (putative c-di-GMP-specific phosphodiesterase class I)
LDHAIAQAPERNRDGRAFPLAVNISAEDPGDPRLDSRVASVLTRHQLPPVLLTLELTESGFIEDPERALRTHLVADETPPICNDDALLC